MSKRNSVKTTSKILSDRLNKAHILITADVAKASMNKDVVFASDVPTVFNKKYIVTPSGVAKVSKNKDAVITTDVAKVVFKEGAARQINSGDRLVASLKSSKAARTATGSALADMLLATKP